MSHMCLIWPKKWQNFCAEHSMSDDMTVMQGLVIFPRCGDEAVPATLTVGSAREQYNEQSMCYVVLLE